MAKHRYKVLREMQGDKFYAVGDERVADAGDVKHLLKAGLLEDLGAEEEPAGEGEKAEDALPNKAEPPVANKADAPAKSTKKRASK